MANNRPTPMPAVTRTRRVTDQAPRLAFGGAGDGGIFPRDKAGDAVGNRVCDETAAVTIGLDAWPLCPLLRAQSTLL